MGQLVDRLPRRAMIGAGIAVWATATTAGGFVRSFAGLFVSRMGVGVGESVLTPAAHSIIAESFPPRRLSTALAFYSCGVSIGSSLAILIGGMVVHWAGDQNLILPIVGAMRPWHVVLLVVGLATFFALPLLLLLPETRPPSLRPEAAAQGGIAAHIFRQWRIFVLLPIGFGCTNIVVNATFAWIPAMLQRAYGWEPAMIGTAIGVQHIVFGLAGQIIMAMLADALFARKMTDAHTRIQIWSLMLSIPLMAVGMVAGSPWLVIVLSTPFVMLSFPFLGYANAALQLLTPSRFRGRVSAIFLAIVTAFGTLLGAPLVGLVTQIGHVDLSKALALITLAGGAGAILCLSITGKALKRAHAQ
jgi:MFS family permease